MRKISVLLAAALFFATASLASAQLTWTAQFGPGRDATQAGSILIEDMGNQVKVTLTMTPGPAGVAQPAHVHEGSCPGVGRVAFPLSNVVDGKSETTLNTTFANLLSKQHAINVHRSAQEVQVYTACSELPTGLVLTMKAGRDANQPAVAVLENLGDRTEVTLIVDQAQGAAPQPAHIHEGTCPGVGRVAFPLTNVTNDMSTTVVNASLATIQSKQHSINIHRSAQEVQVYTACVDIPLAQRATAPSAAPAAAAPTQLPRTGGAPVGLLAALGVGMAGLGLVFRRR